MAVTIYWFRNDLRLTDNTAFTEACLDSEYLLPIYLHQSGDEENTRWGFQRVASHRHKFLQESLQDLKSQLKALGSDLLEVKGEPQDIFPNIAKQLGTNVIYCEQIEAPQEIEQSLVLKNLGFEIHPFWQSSMLNPGDLPFDLKNMPDVFTQFRQQVERQKLKFAKPIVAPARIPPLPKLSHSFNDYREPKVKGAQAVFKGGESNALAHIGQYFHRRLPDTYKQTRNQLIGLDYSSKFSPWLALGCCSARMIAKQLDQYESQHGANEGTYWLWFELLWRDYFRFLHMKYGKTLYRSKGLSDKPVESFDLEIFSKWRAGKTGESLVDAGMHELKETGYLSNRMRQIVASFWVYHLRGDWRAGAAWFESQLIDYDVYSNQGNWLYIAGRGTDPRGGRTFNLAKQTQEHDADGSYRKLWLG